jgi:hypothetical protein
MADVKLLNGGESSKEPAAHHHEHHAAATVTHLEDVIEASEDIPVGSVIAAGGSARPALADGSTRGNAIGIAIAGIIHGGGPAGGIIHGGRPLTYVLAGPAQLPASTWDTVTGDSGGLVQGMAYYLSQVTPGRLTNIPPVSGQRVYVGTALDHSILNVQFAGNVSVVPVGAVMSTFIEPIAVARVNSSNGTFYYQHGFTGSHKNDVGFYVLSVPSPPPGIELIPQVTLIHTFTNKQIATELSVRTGTVAGPPYPPNNILVQLFNSEFGNGDGPVFFDADFYITVFQVVTRALPSGPVGPAGPPGPTGPAGPAGPPSTPLVEVIAASGAATPDFDVTVVENTDPEANVISLGNSTIDGHEHTFDIAAFEGSGGGQIVPASFVDGTAINFPGNSAAGVILSWSTTLGAWFVVSLYNVTIS